jgi:hypothetical protein
MKENVVPLFEKDSLAIDFYPNGDSIVWNFPFQNNSDRTFVIEGINASCGCVLIDKNLIGRNISPGKRGKVDFRIQISQVESQSKNEVIAVRVNHPPFLVLLKVRINNNLIRSKSH